MSNSKLEIQIGEIKFSGEGEEKWLTDQLDKIIEIFPDLLKVDPLSTAKQKKVAEPKKTTPKTEGISSTLAGFLKEKSAITNQAKKFLVAAVYLQNTGKERIATSDVTKALKDARQTKLTNPSDCLNKQVKKGYCEKDGNQFYVTPEGESSL